MKKLRGIFKKFIKGFTLVELIAVMALMAIGAAIAIPNLQGTMTRAERKKYDSYLLQAKTNVQNYVDLLNLSEFSYPVTDTDGVTIVNHNISLSTELNIVLNKMNFDTSFEYYVYDTGRTVKQNGKNVVVYDYNDTGAANPLSSAKAYYEPSSFGGNKDLMIVLIHRKDGGVYELGIIWYYVRSKDEMISYLIYKDQIFHRYTRSGRPDE